MDGGLKCLKKNDLFIKPVRVLMDHNLSYLMSAAIARILLISLAFLLVHFLLSDSI